MWGFLRTRERAPEPRSRSPGSSEGAGQPARSPAGRANAAGTAARAPNIERAQASPAASAEPLHPHPITPQHERIYRENTLLGALNGAMDVRDAPGLRRLLSQYQEEYPEDAHEMQRGYALIADCLESRSDAARAAARNYYDTELASGLRRYIRRYCLE